MQDHDAKNLVRVLLADDHTMFREGLANVLAAYGGIEVVAETTNDEGAITIAREHKPDVVVMQAQLPLERAKETLDQMRRVSPPPKVVNCTMFEDPQFVREFLKLGVSAYLVKSASVEQLIAALRVSILDPLGITWWWACPARCWRRQRMEPGARSALGSWRSCCSRRAVSPTAR